ncbi:hypothetical protein K466DRAFT_212227 [Polyporus arcularius HHB13444]|uniref:Uncharacterized protein n=1 Tax=Polyporus arcularius HHB13444 TaxID=1314778 RepID=A0A5C3PSM7_9APHY|nr:hypothetical protein K466DRAFT_212227 [Polyporus arcularius HHB13444]
MRPPARESTDEESIADGGRIPRPCRILSLLYDAGDGKASLQSQMRLLEDPHRFRDSLKIIRKIWKEHGVDHYLSYSQQDPAKLRSIKLEATKRLPFLEARYEDAWPVTFYLKKALRNRGRDEHRERRRIRDNSDEADYLYDGPPLRTRGRREVHTRASRKSMNLTRHTSVRTTATPASVAPEVPVSQVRRRERAAPYYSSSSSSSSSSARRSYESGPQSTVVTQASTPATSLSAQRSLVTSSPTSSTSWQVAGPNPGTFRHPPTAPAAPSNRESAAGPSTNTVLSALQPYHLPDADAKRVAQLLASVGVVDAAYLHVLARMHGRDGWLCEMRDKGEMTEIQMRVLREILVRLC